ncbi:FAD/NAD(P)-binding domain-containing protein, partial [Saccharata proteae CBS 121410]
GVSCTVFEQSASPTARPRDWNFGIYWAQSPLSECLPKSITDKLPEAQIDDHIPSADDTLQVRNGLTGELMKEVPTPFNLRLRRKKFIELISEGIDIRYGKRLASFTTSPSTVTATFEDDTEHTADLLIGAEGAHSVVRDVLLGPEKAALHPSPIVASVTIATLPEEMAVRLRRGLPRYSTVMHPNGWFAWVGLHNAHSTSPNAWQFLFIQSHPQDSPITLSTSPSILQNMKLLANHFFPLYRDAVHAIPADTPAWHNRLSYWETRPWDDEGGRVTLCGDAAHAMTFHRGQGLNNAVLDADSLVRGVREGVEKGLGKEALREAVRRYQEEVWVRGAEAVRSQNVNSEMIHDWGRVMESSFWRRGVERRD